ncbi:MAG: hypothetical protein HZT40_11180 [Candidatus Thiothrix singaporensis]|uniref:Uncharacterized protein n=1 Tax=Candidatus Thiothrix singaporensis TaxID=2799669 RepID=A0A7L6AMB0_9GAMM|nr:MAG: hypothetical protein HZT40_11180 [Candidatus Thiothrix singaporensis]
MNPFGQCRLHPLAQFASQVGHARHHRWRDQHNGVVVRRHRPGLRLQLPGKRAGQLRLGGVSDVLPCRQAVDLLPDQHRRSSAMNVGGG